MGRNAGAGSGRGPGLGRRFVGAGAFAGASAIGPVTDQGRLDRIRTALREGRDLPPIKATVSGRGEVFIEDGRHRVTVLREPEFRDRRVEVVFRRGRGRGTPL